MYIVRVRWTVVHNPGKSMEYRSASEPEDNGPFVDRSAAEQFAVGVSTNPHLHSVSIIETEDN
jgi:hypothetical protein